MTADQTPDLASDREPSMLSVRVQQWISVGALYVSAAAMILLSLSTWHAIDAATRRNQEISTQQREFNDGLVTAIEDLAQKTGILTSADLCPVRFRLRDDLDGVPLRTVAAMLHRTDTNDSLEYVTSTDSVSGMIEFGLQPPGEYLLSLDTAGLALEHEFQVLPGVPVDRVVKCPRMSRPAEVPTMVRVVVNWPEDLATEELAAVVAFESGPFVSGEWRWEQDGDSSVIAGASTMGESRGLLPPMQIPVPEFLDIQTPDSTILVDQPVLVSGRYYRLNSITFLRRSNGNPTDASWEVLGTAVFGVSDHYRSSDHYLGQRFWRVTETELLFEADPALNMVTWRLEIPQSCLSELVRNIGGSLNRFPLESGA